MKKDIYILGIESSCDDTSVAITNNRKVLSNIVSSQKIHQKYGGVVPELASRSHQKNIIPVTSLALKIANIKKNQLNAIAFTRGPGLLGSLLVGCSFAKSLSLSLKIPLIEINHMRAHVIANFIENKNFNPPSFPFLCLTVSGGHTQIVSVKSIEDMSVIGQTLDDSAGEAFDKSAKLLGLGYPGGPLIEKISIGGDCNKFIFTEPNVDNLNFSFSGLKTQIFMFLKKEMGKNKNFIVENIHHLCASIQKIIVTTLVNKLKKAIIMNNVTNVAIAGGVASNKYFRSEIKKLENELKIKSYFPKIEYSTDNAAMIALSGYYKFRKKEFSNIQISPDCRYKI